VAAKGCEKGKLPYKVEVLAVARRNAAVSVENSGGVTNDEKGKKKGGSCGEGATEVKLVEGEGRGRSPSEKKKTKKSKFLLIFPRGERRSGEENCKQQSAGGNQK